MTEGKEWEPLLKSGNLYKFLGAAPTVPTSLGLIDCLRGNFKNTALQKEALGSSVTTKMSSFFRTFHLKQYFNPFCCMVVNSITYHRRNATI